MSSKSYFTRQADTLLRLAKLTKDRNMALVLTEKAAEMQKLADAASAEPLAEQ